MQNTHVVAFCGVARDVPPADAAIPAARHDHVPLKRPARHGRDDVVVPVAHKAVLGKVSGQLRRRRQWRQGVAGNPAVFGLLPFTATNISSSSGGRQPPQPQHADDAVVRPESERVGAHPAHAAHAGFEGQLGDQLMSRWSTTITGTTRIARYQPQHLHGAAPLVALENGHRHREQVAPGADRDIVDAAQLGRKHAAAGDPHTSAANVGWQRRLHQNRSDPRRAALQGKIPRAHSSTIT